MWWPTAETAAHDLLTRTAECRVGLSGAAFTAENMIPALGDQGGDRVVARAGIEPATFHFSGGRSYRLSYLANRTGRSHSHGSGPRSDPDGT